MTVHLPSADTEVHHDSLNRLIAVAHDDQRILGLCGETKISNERTSLTTMVQVYEYFISVSVLLPARSTRADLSIAAPHGQSLSRQPERQPLLTDFILGI